MFSGCQNLLIWFIYWMFFLCYHCGLTHVWWDQRWGVCGGEWKSVCWSELGWADLCPEPCWAASLRSVTNILQSSHTTNSQTSQHKTLSEHNINRSAVDLQVDHSTSRIQHSICHVMLECVISTLRLHTLMTPVLLTLALIMMIIIVEISSHRTTSVIC